MLNKRLLSLVPDIRGRLANIVFYKWVCLLCGIVSTMYLCRIICGVYYGTLSGIYLFHCVAFILAAVLIKGAFTNYQINCSARLALIAKEQLRNKVFEKLTSAGHSYGRICSTGAAVQVGVEGVEQLESYFGSYLPQFFYALAAPVTLFVVIGFFSLRAACVLLICVPLIPLSIIAVQKFAKKLLGKYWTAYTDLGDGFLENIQGLTTLKIYRADEQRHRLMDENAELFRKATMRVLIMQLNSISVMDIVAYGGAAAGIIAVLYCLRADSVGLYGALVTVLLSAEFFIPMRQLGSFFHVAMNGAAAADKIFAILDAPAPEVGSIEKPLAGELKINGLSFAYDNKPVLKNINISTEKTGLYGIAGKSGCGKSTLAGLLTGRLTPNDGSVTIGGGNIRTLSDSALSQR